MIDIRKAMRYHNLVNITDEQIQMLGIGVMYLIDKSKITNTSISDRELTKLLYEQYGIITAYASTSKHGIIRALITYTDTDLKFKANFNNTKIWKLEFPLEIIIKTINAIHTGEIDYRYLNVKDGALAYEKYKKAGEKVYLRPYKGFTGRVIPYIERCKANCLREEYYRKSVELGKLDVLSIYELVEEWRKEDALIDRISNHDLKKLNKNYIPLQQKYQKLIDELDRA